MKTPKKLQTAFVFVDEHIVVSGGILAAACGANATFVLKKIHTQQLKSKPQRKYSMDTDTDLSWHYFEVVTKHPSNLARVNSTFQSERIMGRGEWNGIF